MGEFCPFLYSCIMNEAGRRGKVHGGLPELENVEQNPGISDTETAPHSGAMLFKSIYMKNEKMRETSETRGTRFQISYRMISSLTLFITTFQEYPS